MRWLPPISALALVLCAAPAAAQDTGPAFSFPPDDKPSVTWEDLSKPEGAEISLLNDTAREQDVTIKVALIEDEQGVALCVDACVTATAEPSTVPPGEGATVILRVKAETKKPASNLTGTLAVISKSGAFARVPLAVVVATPKVAAKPLGTTAQADIVCQWPLQGACHGHAVWVPLDDSVKPDTALDLKTGIVGAVEADGEVVPVTYSGGRRTIDGLRELELVVGPVSSAGEFTGTVDLVTSDDKAGDVKVTALVKDAFKWFLIVAVIGFLIALGVAWLTLRQAVGGLELLLLDAEADIDDAKRRFKAGTHPWSSGYDVESFAAADAAAVRVQLAALLRSELGDLDADQREEVEKAIAPLAAGGAALDTLGATLASLQTALAEARRRCDPLPPLTGIDVGGAPPLTAHVEALYAGKIASLAGLTARQAEVTSAAAFVAAWRNRERAISERQKWFGEVRERLSPADAEEVRVLLSLAWSTLWHYADDFALPEWTTRARIDDLLAGANVPAPTRALAPAGDGLEAAILESPPQPPVPPAERARRLRSRQWALAVLLMLIGAVIAVATLWAAEYDGKPWGTPGDYVAVLLAGIAGPAIVTAYEKVKQARA